MNGKDDRLLHTSLDGMAPNPRRKCGWRLFAAQLWLLAAFAAMSLVAVAAKSLIADDEPREVSSVLGVAGVAQLPLTWRNVARMLEAADGKPAPPGNKARGAEQLKLALHSSNDHALQR